MRTINRKINLIVIHCSATRVDKDYTSEQLERDHKARGFNSMRVITIISGRAGR